MLPLREMEGQAKHVKVIQGQTTCVGCCKAADPNQESLQKEGEHNGLPIMCRVGIQTSQIYFLLNMAQKRAHYAGGITGFKNTRGLLKPYSPVILQEREMGRREEELR